MSTQDRINLVKQFTGENWYFVPDHWYGDWKLKLNIISLAKIGLAEYRYKDGKDQYRLAPMFGPELEK